VRHYTRKFEKMNTFLENINNLTTEFEYRRNNKIDIGFNIFKISSDLYYRENFQSDIISAFLNPKQNHNENSKYLHLFIDLINKGNLNKKINKKDFENSTVFRERNNIDILIVDDYSKKAIIIENKINEANDMYKQLPRYLEIVKKDYEVESIAYITLKANSKPDKLDWTEEEINEIDNLICLIPSFSIENELNLYKDWIIPSIIESKNIDSSLILRQYGNLLKHLNTNNVDTIILEKFHSTLLESDKLKTAITVRNMLNELPEYLAIRIENKYKKNCYPFEKIWRYKLNDTVFEAFRKENIYLKLDIWCTENGYRVHFWNPHNSEFDMLQELKHFKSLANFIYNKDEKNNIITDFTIESEKKLFQFIDSLIVELKIYKEQ